MPEYEKRATYDFHAPEPTHTDRNVVKPPPHQSCGSQSESPVQVRAFPSSEHNIVPKSSAANPSTIPLPPIKAKSIHPLCLRTH
ncbi:hypothetical protein PAAG_12072 [Paracoccidioides lutzii Pb01]|uniref:Uncharacterized protein n=1 Tax=Paracoccidioides lutzii (strain ATCC MYA-826 / Pb01) TaxID=502779 RepID=A0A0A2VK15_PARBA|nr:hypothetical protein PAAG_12072 [Paracoccidioides lutzii Pb01]KGQ01214.1 hypothetical protein PAAG_12072 [Paracoccidioides lutzii Pb01]